MHSLAAHTQVPWRSLDEWLIGVRRPIVVSHRKPDGDSMGAIAAMSLALAARGADPRATLYEPYPRRYPYLESALAWRRWDLERDALVAGADALVILDTCSFNQLESLGDFLASAPPTLVIDHHPNPNDIGIRPGDLRLIDPTASATCLLLAEWLEHARTPLGPRIAEALFTGLATDTGWFRFSNADPRTFHAAARLTTAGVAPNALYRSIYERDSPARLRLIGRMLQSLELLANGRLALLKLRTADFEASAADPSATEDIINQAGSLEGVEGIVLFTEDRDGAVRVNLRSKAALDVAALAAQFGGGGHARAAGARPAGKWDDLVPRITNAAVAALA